MADSNSDDPYAGKTRNEKLYHYFMNDSIPAQIAKSIWSGITLPGDVYAGRVDPMSDEGIGRSLDLAGLLGLSALKPARGRASGAGVKASSASKVVPGNNPPAKPPRPFEADYPNGAQADAAGRLTQDIEGRPLTARHVVGRSVVGEPDQPLGFDGHVSAGTHLTREGIKQVIPSDIGGNAGRATFQSGSRTPLRIDLSTKLTESQFPRVLGHELGHVIDETAGQISTTGLNTELRQMYNTLNTGQERTTRLTGPQHLGYAGKEIPREMMAEAIRAYMADPNYIKTVSPKTAARIREMVNTNPKLKDTIQFNASGLPVTWGDE